MTVTAVRTAKPILIYEWVFRVLGKRYPSSTNFWKVSEEILEEGHTLTLAQVDEMVARAERGRNTGLSMSGGSNYFFVESEEYNLLAGTSRAVPGDPVSICSVEGGKLGWSATVYDCSGLMAGYQALGGR